MQGLTNRQRVVQEILTTEQSYRRSLNVLKDQYVSPLRLEARKIPAMLTLSEVNSLFSDVDAICRISDKILEDMENCGEDLEFEVGKIFCDIAPLLKLYTSYVNSHHRALETHRFLLENRPTYEAFCQSCTSDQDSALFLDSYLILPVQRVPRYEMLLKELLKQTDTMHPDYAVLVSALNKVSTVASTINQNLADYENRTAVLAVQQKFGNSVQLVAPQRWFVREGMMRKVCKRKPKAYLFVLFNDILIYGEPLHNLINSKSGYKYHRTIELENADVYVCENSSIGEPQFLLSSPSKSFKIVCISKKDRDEWVKDIQNHIDENKRMHESRSSGSHARRSSLGGSSLPAGPVVAEHAPVKNHGVNVHECDLCHVEFSYLRRRKQCNRCGAVICEKCSPHKLLVGKSRQRVCSICFLQGRQSQGLLTPPRTKVYLTEEESKLGRRCSAPILLSPPYNSELSKTVSLSSCTDDSECSFDHLSMFDVSTKSARRMTTGSWKSVSFQSSVDGHVFNSPATSGPPPLPPRKGNSFRENNESQHEGSRKAMQKSIQNENRCQNVPPLPPRKTTAPSKPLLPPKPKFINKKPAANVV